MFAFTYRLETLILENSLFTGNVPSAIGNLTRLRKLFVVAPIGSCSLVQL